MQVLDKIFDELNEIWHTPYLYKFERLNKKEVKRTNLKNGVITYHSDKTWPEYIYVDLFLKRNFRNPRFDFINSNIWYTKWEYKD